MTPPAFQIPEKAHLVVRHRLWSAVSGKGIPGVMVDCIGEPLAEPLSCLHGLETPGVKALSQHWSWAVVRSWVGRRPWQVCGHGEDNARGCWNAGQQDAVTWKGPFSSQGLGLTATCPAQNIEFLGTLLLCAE